MVKTTAMFLKVPFSTILLYRICTVNYELDSFLKLFMIRYGELFPEIFHFKYFLADHGWRHVLFSPHACKAK